MPVLKVGTGVVFIAQPLSGIDAIVFNDAVNPSSALFASHYFDNTKILDGVSITGSAASNTISIIAGPFPPLIPANSSSSIDASGWTFANWSADDQISFTALGNASIIGTSMADTIISGGQSTIGAGEGDDKIIVAVDMVLPGGTFLDGPIVIDAGGGDDTVTFQQGGGANSAGSLFDGGAGDDKAVLAFADVTADLNINFNDGSDVGIGISILNFETLHLLSGSGNDRVTGGGGADFLFGGGGNDLLRGKRGDDGLLGQAGNDRLDGSSGRDLIAGEDGRDKLWGGTGNDGLAGGKGNDRLDGGLGFDSLLGDAGFDVFVFLAAADTATGKRRDTIADFTQGEDSIDLLAIDANAGTPGDEAFGFIGKDRFSGVAGELRYRQLTDLTIVSGDTNGDKVADFEIGFKGPIIFVSTDFGL